METNVKILIVVVVVAVVLAGIFFFGDKFSLIYDNFIPKTEVIEPEDEIIPIGERVAYRYDIPSKGDEEKIVSMSAREVLDTLGENTILKVNRDGKTIVEGNFQSYEDVNSKTEIIEISFSESLENKFLVYLDYDARLKRAEAKYFISDKPNVIYDLNCIGEDKFKETLGFYILIEKEKEALVKTVCKSNSFVEFVQNVLEMVGDPLGAYECKIKINGEFVDVVPGSTKNEKQDTVFQLLIKNRLNYIPSWGSNGAFLNDVLEKERYSCYFSESGLKKCSKKVDSYGAISFFNNSELSYNLKYGDEIFYVKGNEIWRMIYPDFEIFLGNLEYKSRLDEMLSNGEYRWGVENHCYASLIEGGRCQ